MPKPGGSGSGPSDPSDSWLEIEARDSAAVPAQPTVPGNGQDYSAACQAAETGWLTKVRWASELDLEQFRPVEWLIDGVLPMGGLGLIAGKSKIGKSWLVLHVAICISAGRLAFGKLRCEQGAVLYLALEDNNRRLQERIRKLVGAEAVPERLGLYTEWVTVDDGCLDRVKLFIEAHPDTKLVIIDTFAKIRGKPDGRSSVYQQDYRDMAEFKRLADLTGITILLVHHTRKQDASDALDLVSGSTGIVGAADTIMVLTRPRGSEDGTLIVTGRDIKDDVEQAARFDRETGLWTLLGPVAQIKEDSAASKIRSYLASIDEPSSIADIATAINLPYQTVKSSLFRHKEHGFEKISHGLYGLAGRTYAQPI